MNRADDSNQSLIRIINAWILLIDKHTETRMIFYGDIN
jgi:hypothetical protein